MKALQITGYGKLENNLEFSDVPKPKINENQILLKIHAASVNPIDYKIVKGLMRVMKKLDFPAPIGFDASGVVVEKGSQVTSVDVGDEIFTRVSTDLPGTFAEYIAVDDNLVCPKPSNVNFKEAASFPLVGMTTMQSFETAGLKAADRVLIHAGSGGIGTFAIQYAKSKGAYVYTTTSTDNTAWVKELGADRVIDYKKENYLDIVNNLDIVFDTLGGQYSYDAFKTIKDGGFVVSIAGDIDNESADEMGLNILIKWFMRLKMWRINREVKRKSASYKFVTLKPNNHDLEMIKELVEEGQIEPVIDRVYPLSQAVKALKHQETGRAKGKIIIDTLQST